LADTPARPPFEPLNELERLLMQAATDEDQRTAFTRALLEAPLYAVSPDELPEGDQVLLAEARVSLAMVPLEDGGSATAVFTAAERVGQVYGPDVHALGMKGADLIAMVIERPLLLNPGLSYGVLWSPQDLTLLLGRPVSRTLGADTTVLLGSPSERPDDLLMRLAEAFQPEPAIEAAWLALAQWPSQGEFAWYLDVRTRLSHDQVNALLARAVEGADLQGKHLDMRISPPGGEPGTGLPVVQRG
jgi:hypothetical protein